MKSFVEPGNLLPAYQTVNRGIININQEKIYQITYTLNDLHGNTAVFQFEIIGEKQMIPIYQPRGTYFPYNQNNHLKKDGVELGIPFGNLYTDLDFLYFFSNDYTPFSHLYKLHQRTPLHASCPLSITITNDTFHDKNKYGIVAVENERMSWIGGKYNDGIITAGIRELGNYTVTIDTVPPTITENNSHMWSKNQKISFRVNDNLSGIKQWSATLGGEFVLFELDAKNNALFCKFDPTRMKKGKQPLMIWVEDACGNKSIYEKEIVWSP